MPRDQRAPSLRLNALNMTLFQQCVALYQIFSATKGKAHRAITVSFGQSRRLRIRKTKYAPASSTAKYFDRNARPRKIPLTAYQRHCASNRARTKLYPERKTNRISGVSVVTRFRAQVNGRTRNILPVRYATSVRSGSSRRKRSTTPRAIPLQSMTVTLRKTRGSFEIRLSTYSSQPTIGG